jgi:hypothetical protein
MIVEQNKTKTLKFQNEKMEEEVICTKGTARNLVVCNSSMWDYMQPNVAYDYKWLLMQLLFKFG